MRDALTFWCLGVCPDRNLWDPGCNGVGEQVQDAELEAGKIGQDDSQDPQQLLILRFIGQVVRGRAWASKACSISRGSRQLNGKYVSRHHTINLTEVEVVRETRPVPQKIISTDPIHLCRHPALSSSRFPIICSCYRRIEVTSDHRIQPCGIS